MKKKLLSILLAVFMMVTSFTTRTIVADEEVTELSFSLAPITKSDFSNLPSDGNIENDPEEVNPRSFSFYLFNENNELIDCYNGSWKDGSYNGESDFSDVAYVIEEIDFGATDSPFAETMTIKVNDGKPLDKILYSDLHTGVEGYIVKDEAVYINVKVYSSLKTIDDILPSNFPASAEDNSWCESVNGNVYIYKKDSNLVFNDKTDDCYSVPLSSSLTKEENPEVSYVYSVGETEIQFNMTGDNNDELKNIVVNKCTIFACVGTYAAPEAFSVTYDANGATSGTAPANQTKTAGVNLTLATNTGNLAKTGYTFDGWNTQANGEGDHYNAGAAYTTDAALTLYAEWAIEATPAVAKIGDTKYETLDGAINDKKNSLKLDAIIEILSTEDLFFTANLNIGEFFLVNDYTHVMYPEGYYCTPVKSSDEIVGYKIGPGIASITKNSTTTFYETLNKATTAAQNGDTVVLLKDIDNGTTSKNYEAGVFYKDITIDLNGHYIKGSYNGGAEGKGIIYTYGDYSTGDTADLIITDNSVLKSGYLENTNSSGYGVIFQYDYSNVTLKNITIKGASDGVYQFDTHDTLTVGSNTSINVSGLNGVRVNGRHNSVIVDGGSISAGSFAINVQNSYFTATVNSGTVSSSYGIFSNSSGSNATVNVEGGTVKGSGNFGAIYLQGKSTVNITGGNITGGQYGIYSSKDSSTINISGGTVSGSLIGVYSKGAKDKVTISDKGTVTCSGNGYGVYTTGSSTQVSVTGGSVTAPYAIDLEGADSTVTVDDDGIVTGNHTGIYLGSSGNQAIINGGTTSGTVTGIYVGKVTSGTQNSVTVAGGTVKVTGAEGETAIALWGGAKFTMTSGTVESTTEAFAIANNGSNTIDTTINISGGTVSAPVAGSTAIYHAGPGTASISGTASITGYDAGIEIRNGTLNVSGGSITSTANTFSCNANSNGTTTVGAALAIAQHTTKQEITVNLTGGTFKGIVPVNECNPQENDPAPQVNMIVSDGEFWSTATENAKVFSCVDCDKFISGGFFTHVPDLKYIAPEKVVRDTTAQEKTDHGSHYLYTLGVIDNLQNIIKDIIDEKQEEETTSTIIVTNGDTPISAEIDDKVEIIAKKVPDASTGDDTNEIIAEPGYKMNNPIPKDDGNLLYTATALDIGKDYLGGDDGSGIKDSKKTNTELKQAAEGTTQAVKDSAISVIDTNANEKLEIIVHDDLNTILFDRGIHQGTAARALNKAGIAVTNEGGEGITAAKNVNVYVLTYYDTKVLEDKTTQINKSFTLDITPMYQAYASTAEDKDSMIIEGTNIDSVKIGDSLPVNCEGKIINLKIQLPDGFIENVNQKVYVIHHSTNGKKTYDTTVTKESDKYYIEFTNPDGFSEFEITLNKPTPKPRYVPPKTGVDGRLDNSRSILKLSSLSLLTIGTYLIIKKKKDND